MRWTPVLLIRLIGILLCSCSVMLTLLHPTGPQSQATSLLSAIVPGLSLSLEHFLSLVSPLLIGVMLWVCTGAHIHREASPALITLLAVQTALALLIAPELQFIVAVEAGLLLQPRWGAIWVTAQAGGSWLGAVVFPQLMAWLLPANADSFRRTLGIGLFMLIAMLYNLFAFGLGWLAATERRQAHALEATNRQLRTAQAGASQSARLSERLAIARELHDAIGHQLTALSLNLQVATHLATGAAKDSVAQAYAMTGQLLSDVRRVVSSIREPSQIDFVAAMNSFVFRLDSPKVHLSLAPIPKWKDGGLSYVILRCSQEIITNAIRHSSASNLWIESAIEGEWYTLSAHDDGNGVHSVSLGNGLKGIEERVQSHQGSVAFESYPNQGFRVQIRVPLMEAAQ